MCLQTKVQLSDNTRQAIKDGKKTDEKANNTGVNTIKNANCDKFENVISEKPVQIKFITPV